MSVSIVVMAHPSRRAAANRLSAELDAPIVWDRIGAVWETCLRALEAHDRSAKHHLIVQDDAILSRDVRLATEQASAAMEHGFSLYAGWRPETDRPFGVLFRRAERLGIPWVSGRGPHWGVANAHPVDGLEQLIWRYRQWDTIRPDDTRLTKCYALMNRPWRWMTRSIVDHDPAGDSLTKPGFYKPDRHAFAFVGRDGTGVGVDYTAPPLVAHHFRRTP